MAGVLAPAWARTLAAAADATPASAQTRIETHPPGDIPARADEDEQFIQPLLRRSKLTNAAPCFEASLTRETQAVNGLNASSSGDDLALLSVPRLEACSATGPSAIVN